MKSTYNILHNSSRGEIDDFFCLIWKTPNAKFFVWRADLNRIQTKDNLLKKRV